MKQLKISLETKNVTLKDHLVLLVNRIALFVCALMLTWLTQRMFFLYGILILIGLDLISLIRTSKNMGIKIGKSLLEEFTISMDYLGSDGQNLDLARFEVYHYINIPTRLANSVMLGLSGMGTYFIANCWSKRVAIIFFAVFFSLWVILTYNYWKKSPFSFLESVKGIVFDDPAIVDHKGALELAIEELTKGEKAD